MKKSRIIQAAIVVAFAGLLVSCGPSRQYPEYSYYPPRNQSSFSLIINPGPGVYASRYYDGRYYYRSPQGYMYWKGNDNRYYPDRSALGKVQYRNGTHDWHRYYGGTVSVINGQDQGLCGVKDFVAGSQPPFQKGFSLHITKYLQHALCSLLFCIHPVYQFPILIKIDDHVLG